MIELSAGCDVMLVEEAIWVLAERTSSPAYDFAFDSWFACQRPWRPPNDVTAIARVGAPSDYDSLFEEWADRKIRLVNSPQQHRNGSELPYWYAIIEGLTPKSLWFDAPPPANAFAEWLEWPVFVKGARQTSRHDPQKSIARNPEEYARLVEDYRQDPILGWQRCVVREYVKLRPVACKTPIKIPPSFEFRTFWWQRQLVAAGPYWSQIASYSWTDVEREECLRVAQEVANRIDCPFLVVDMAQTADGRWIVIECNDAQESGYAGVSPFALWSEIIRLNKRQMS